MSQPSKHPDLSKSPLKPVFVEFEMEYATREAREASFAPPTKRSKAGWPHKTPTPADLAKAGFFYKPSTSKDNVECFSCARNLDGWEEEDDALQEHLKHGADCSWALLMSIGAEPDFDTSNMEDPTGAQLTEARRTTFTKIGWPHEGKRAWTCKTEKMVEAGWHFAPTAESEDFVSCVYCKLSVDGWEPKDNPFEEHYRRSPQCQFFVFAGTTAPSKRPKAKKGRASKASRTSKASRLSTQSNTTLLSQTEDIPDLDLSIDSSNMSIMSTASTATSKGKRKGPGRAKGTKTKKAKTTRSKAKEIEQNVEEEQEQPEQQEYSSLSKELEAKNVQKDVKSTVIENIESDVEPEAVGPPEEIQSTVPALASSPLQAQQDRSRHAMPPSETPQKKRQPKKVSAVQAQRSPSQPSDVENAPPSSRPESERPPLSSPGAAQPQWSPVDIEMVFQTTPVVELFKTNDPNELPEQEKQMTVQEWIEHVAGKADEDLRAEGERVVGVFEREGQRALTVLESIVCI